MILEKQLSKKNKWEYIIPILAIASLVVSCIIVSSKKFFWMDELFSYYLIGDQSFMHMMVAFSDKFNNTPPLYFLLGWLWTKLFGSTELSLRLFSSLGMCIACATVWITLRRTYNFWSASIGTLGVFCISDIILVQNAEARMYGLLLAVCALGLLEFDFINRSKKCSWGLIISNTCIHAAIVQTHLYGLFYSGAILFALIIRDKYFKIFRPKIYLSIILSWLSLIPYVGPFLNQADAGNPRSWLPIPHPNDLINSLSLSSYSLSPLFLILFLILISSIQFIKYKNNNQYVIDTSNKQRDSITEISLLILAYAFLTVPVLSWIISRTLKPIFYDRYLIPTTLSWSILLAYLSSRIILPTSVLSKSVSGKLRAFRFLVSKQRLTLLTLTIILLLNPVSYAKDFPQQQLPGLKDDSYGYNELPIVVEDTHEFIRRFHYSPKRKKYYFVLDWQAALDKRSGLSAPQDYKIMDALRRNYPSLFHNNIVQSKDFLNIHNSFLVLNQDTKCTSRDIFCHQWFELRIKSNSNYRITPLGIIDGMSLLLVSKK